ncbi:MAG: hypothetical protein ABFS17_07075 [Chloroflexota bacterium]
MRDWNRTSEEISLSDLPADCQAVIEKHTEAYNLGDILDQPVMVIKIISNKLKKGLFSGKPKLVESYAALTPGWLVWTVSTDGDPPTALSAQLTEIVVEDYLESSFYALVQDNGFSITGILTGLVGTDGQQQSSMFIGLGDDPDGDKFKAAFIEAIQNSRR